MKRNYIEMIHVQLQQGGFDCGLFSIAFATALANNKHPEQFLFKQDKMREHLHQCLTNEEITMFPAEERRKRVKVVDTIKLYCDCRMPEIPPMVDCSHCCTIPTVSQYQ